MTLDQLDPRIANRASLSEWQDVLDVLNTGAMPPEDGGCIKNLRLGESIKLPQDTPLANVWLTLLQQAGIPIDRFSHSTGTLGELLA